MYFVQKLNQFTKKTGLNRLILNDFALTCDYLMYFLRFKYIYIYKPLFKQYFDFVSMFAHILKLYENLVS